MPKRKDISVPTSLARTSLEIDRALFARVKAIATLEDVAEREIFHRAIGMWVAGYETGALALRRDDKSLAKVNTSTYTSHSEAMSQFQAILDTDTSESAAVRLVVARIHSALQNDKLLRATHGGEDSTNSGISDSQVQAAADIKRTLGEVHSDAGPTGQHQGPTGVAGKSVREGEARDKPRAVGGRKH